MWSVGEVAGLCTGGGGLQRRGPTGDRALTVPLFTIHIRLQALGTMPPLEVLQYCHHFWLRVLGGMNWNTEESLLTLWNGVRRITSLTPVKQKGGDRFPHPTHHRTSRVWTLRWWTHSNTWVFISTINRTGLTIPAPCTERATVACTC